jgi:hypothetical protein
LRIAAVLSLLAATCASSPAVAQQSFAAGFPARILAIHNTERTRAGVPPLVWDNALGTAAAGYATRLAMSGVFAHSDRAARPGTGENLWMGTHGAFSVEAMVAGWSSEKRFFKPGIFPNVSRTGDWENVGHYTQMIWPQTTKVGCAIAATPRVDYLVCRYAYKGNVDGRAVGYAVAEGTAWRHGS